MLSGRASARIAAVTAALAVLLLAPPSAAAHAKLQASSPADGATVTGPVSQVTLTFTKPVTLIDGGCEVMHPDGAMSAPVPQTDDNLTVRLDLTAPVTAGSVGVRYRVGGEDGHIIEGTLSFNVVADPAAVPAAADVPTTHSMAAMDAADHAAMMQPVAASSSAAPGDSLGAGVYGAAGLAVAAGLGGFFVVRTRRFGRA